MNRVSSRIYAKKTPKTHIAMYTFHWYYFNSSANNGTTPGKLSHKYIFVHEICSCEENKKVQTRWWMNQQKKRKHFFSSVKNKNCIYVDLSLEPKIDCMLCAATYTSLFIKHCKCAELICAELNKNKLGLIHPSVPIHIHAVRQYQFIILCCVWVYFKFVARVAIQQPKNILFTIYTECKNWCMVIVNSIGNHKQYKSTQANKQKKEFVYCSEMYLTLSICHWVTQLMMMIYGCYECIMRT